MRDTIYFSGTSHTIGKGIEWEVDPELNSEEYLQKGVFLPSYTDYSHRKYEEYWQTHRWSRLVCEELGYIEYNFHDEHTGKLLDIGYDARSTILHFYIRRNEPKVKELLARLKYIVLEIGYVRWWDEKLHGKVGGELLPNTPLEIENYINSENPDPLVVDKAIEWVVNHQTNDKKIWEDTYVALLKFVEEFPDITIIMIPWKGGNIPDHSKNANVIKKWFMEVDDKWENIYDYLKNNNLLIYHTAKAFNGNYKYDQLDEHASIEGHKRVANLVIKHIKKLENTNI